MTAASDNTDRIMRDLLNASNDWQPSIFADIDRRWAAFDEKWAQIDYENRRRYSCPLEGPPLLNQWTYLKIKEESFARKMLAA